MSSTVFSFLLLLMTAGAYGASLRNDVTQNYAINVNYDGLKNEKVVQCISNATETIQLQTNGCFTVGNETTSSEGININVRTSDRCGYTETNKTIFISDSCINEDICLKLIGRAISDTKQTTQNVIADLLEKKCEGNPCLPCQNQGIQGTGCKCHCLGEGIFKGDQCQEVDEELVAQLSPDCGVFNNSMPEGQLQSNLNTSKCFWFLTSEDPWDVFEITFDKLDLAKKTGQPCGDHLIVHGVKNLASTHIPCDTQAQLDEVLYKTFVSEGNKVLIDYTRPSSFKKPTNAGPTISYKKLPKLSDEVDTSYIPSSSDGSANSAIAVGAFVGGGTMLICIIGSLAMFFICCKENF